MPWRNRYNGIVLIDKPSGVTSHDVVQNVRYMLQQREVGHTGTLDPLATGLLVLCLGKATKVAQFICGMDKSYAADIRLGIRSTTYDAEGVTDDVARGEVPEFTPAQLQNTLTGFVGIQLQKVPAHSAVRVNGQHLYELARQGETVEQPIREVEIGSIQMTGYESPMLHIVVQCSKGTYIRTLAHEIGERLGCGAYLAGLRRTTVGPFKLGQAATLDQLAAWEEAGETGRHLMSLEQVLQFGAVRIRDEFEQAVGYGRTPQWQDVLAVEGSFEAGDRVVVKSHLGAVLAVAIAGSSSHGFAERTGQPVASYVRVLA